MVNKRLYWKRHQAKRRQELVKALEKEVQKPPNFFDAVTKLIVDFRKKV